MEEEKLRFKWIVINKYNITLWGGMVRQDNLIDWTLASHVVGHATRTHGVPIWPNQTNVLISDTCDRLAWFSALLGWGEGTQNVEN